MAPSGNTSTQLFRKYVNAIILKICQRNYLGNMTNELFHELHTLIHQQQLVFVKIYNCNIWMSWLKLEQGSQFMLGEEQIRIYRRQQAWMKIKEIQKWEEAVLAKGRRFSRKWALDWKRQGHSGGGALLAGCQIFLYCFSKHWKRCFCLSKTNKKSCFMLIKVTKVEAHSSFQIYVWFLVFCKLNSRSLWDIDYNSDNSESDSLWPDN